MKRGIIGVALIGAAALTTAACGGSDGGSAGAPRSSVDPNSVAGTITWWDTSDATNEAPAYRTLIGRFEAKYPKIKVSYVNVPFSNAENNFKTAAQAGKGAPDVMRADVGWTPTFASLGYLQPLDGTPALAGDGDYLAGAYATDHLNGHVYGVPEVTDTLALLYNKTLFKQAGIANPPATWDELRTDARTIEQKVPGTTGVFVDPDSYYLLPFVYGEGGDYVNAAAKKITISSPAVAQGVATAQQLSAGGVGRTDTSSNGYTNMQNDFKSGKVAMIVNGPWSTADDLKGSAFTDPTSLGVAKVPAGPKGQGGPTGGHNLVVYAGSGNLPADYLFVQFMNSAASQAFVAGKNNTLPTHQAAYSMSEVTGNPLLAAFAGPLQVSKGRPAAAGAGDLFDVITPYYQKIMSNQVSTSEGLGQAQQAAAKYVPGYSAG
jgi:arabinogalactan oligomer/maltooligosaccharide transport system substrate-binding protein